MARENLGIIYLEPTGIYFYGSNITTSLPFRFTPDMVSDLDVINRDMLETEISMFIDSHKILPCELIVVLSSQVLFEKEFLKPVPNPNEENKVSVNQAEEILNFLNYIPFEDVDSKSYITEKGSIIFAVNKQLYDSIKKPFEKKGFTVSAVTPAPVLGKDLVVTGQLSPQTFRLLKQKLEYIKQNSLEFNQPSLQVRQTHKNHKPNRLLFLAYVFFILLAALPVVYYISNLSPATQVATQPTITTAPLANISPSQAASSSVSTVNDTSSSSADISSTPGASISPTVTIPPVDLQTIAIRIVSSSSRKGQADDLKKQLSDLGFKNINTQFASVNNGKTTIVFSKDITVSTKERLIFEINKFLSPVSVLENDAEKSIIITIKTI